MSSEAQMTYMKVIVTTDPPTLDPLSQDCLLIVLWLEKARENNTILICFLLMPLVVQWTPGYYYLVLECHLDFLLDIQNWFSHGLWHVWFAGVGGGNGHHFEFQPIPMFGNLPRHRNADCNENHILIKRGKTTLLRGEEIYY